MTALKILCQKFPLGKDSRTAISIIIRDKINPVLPFLSELGYSFDNEIHERIHECYKDLSELRDDLVWPLSGKLSRSVACSNNKYLVNILCPERQIFCTDDFNSSYICWELNLVTAFPCVPCAFPLDSLMKVRSLYQYA